MIIGIPDLSLSSLTSQTFMTIGKVQGSKTVLMMEEDQVRN